MKKAVATFALAVAAALSGYSASERSANTETLGKRIDYIFTSFGTEVESFATRNDARPNKNYYPSDHYPMLALPLSSLFAEIVPLAPADGSTFETHLPSRDRRL